MYRILVLVLALGAGGLAAWLAMGVSTQPVAQRPAAVEAPVQAPLQEVLVASADLASGLPLEESHLRWQEWEGDVPAVFISRAARPDAISELKGSTVRMGFVAGEPVREDRLARPGSGFLSGMLPEGKRAIAVRVSAESAAGGFVLPGDRVDVIHTVAKEGPDGQPQVFSRALLRNVRVLAVDQTAAEGTDGIAVVGKTATLEVEPEHVSAISAAQAAGSVSLALRSAAEQEGPAFLVAETEGKATSTTVRIVSGGKSSLVEVPSSSGNSIPEGS